jgi:dynein heavy chain
MITVLNQEIKRYNKLLETILKTTKELIKALKGESMISSTTENIFNSFLLQKIPLIWEVSLCFFFKS